MSKSKQALAEAILARMSRGAVPMDGLYWIDVQAARRKATGATVAAADVQSGAAGEKASAAGRQASGIGSQVSAADLATNALGGQISSAGTQMSAADAAKPRARSKLTGWLTAKWWPLRRIGAQS